MIVPVENPQIGEQIHASKSSASRDGYTLANEEEQIPLHERYTPGVASPLVAASEDGADRLEDVERLLGPTEVKVDGANASMEDKTGVILVRPIFGFITTLPPH